MLNVFGDFDPKEYEAEVEERWGGTPAWQESKRRTGPYSKEQWREVMEEGESISRAFTEGLEAGTTPDSIESMDLAEKHRLHINRWFYECSHAMHARLGTLYVTDPRFMEYYDKYATGLADFVKTAIDANRTRNET